MPPAVKGLREAQFPGEADDCFTIVDFAEVDVANLLKSLREFLIAEFGIEKADKAMPPWDVTYTQNTAAIESGRENTQAAPDRQPAAKDYSERFSKHERKHDGDSQSSHAVCAPGGAFECNSGIRQRKERHDPVGDPGMEG